MERLTVQVGSFDVNCSILSENGTAWIVDPGMDADRIGETLDKKGLVPEGVFLTHGHFDHIGAVAGLQRRYPGLKVYVHPRDVPVLTHPMNAFPPEYPAVSVPENIVDESGLPEKFKVLETPGHTPGGVCCFIPEAKLLLAGDTLFAGSVGRTDLPGGDMPTLMKSLELLKSLPDDTLVIPGHGMHTTIGREKASNPFMAGGY